ncbi:MAG: hypothetical protein ACTHJ5_07835 [Ilyomonas sp.]
MNTRNEKVIGCKPEETVVIMVSIGNRHNYTKYTYPAMAKWASKHGYSSILLKKPFNPKNRVPHFNKLLAPKAVSGFKKYIIVDDDLLIKANAPVVEDVPEGYVGLCKDAEQRNTDASYVEWTANTGFIVADEKSVSLLEEAYYLGEHNYIKGDGSFMGIWPYFGDQSILNHLLYKKEKIYELNWKWNYQPVLDFFVKEESWHKWQKSKFYRLKYYSTLRLSFITNQYKKRFKEAYGIHMILCPYPAFFSKFINS